MYGLTLKQTLQADYVEAARARGIPERTIIVSHALKNAMIPVITVLGLTFAALLGGAVSDRGDFFLARIGQSFI